MIKNPLKITDYLSSYRALYGLWDTLWSKVLSIRKSSDLEPLPKLHESEQFHGTVFLDFEKLAEQYDAIELFVYGDFDLQGLLGTWDCDCVLVLNQDAVQEIPQE